MNYQTILDDSDGNGEPVKLKLLNLMVVALALALANAGNSRVARMAIIAITTSSSIRVNAVRGQPSRADLKPIERFVVAGMTYGIQVIRPGPRFNTDK